MAQLREGSVIKKSTGDEVIATIEDINNRPSPTKSDIGLGDVDNTSDINKPVSTAMQTALNGKVDNSQVLTNVPSGAKFTDTVTSINGKTGTITKTDITALGIPAKDTTYGVANVFGAGLMGSYLFYPHPEFERIDANKVHDATYGLTVTQSIAKLDVDKANKTQVLTDVPANAKFTDTNTVTTINGKTGAISKADIVALGIPAQDTVYTHPGSGTNPHGTTKSDVGLGSVDNKSSATIRGEITSSNVTTALGYTPINNSLKGVNNGLAELDDTGKIPSSQLPSYVDDVLEYATLGNFPTTGETGKIYVATGTNLTYRWGGSGYVEISPSLALGETSSTAYRGDRGKTAYDHSQGAHARTDATKTENSTTNGNIKVNGAEVVVYTHPGGTNPHGTTKADVGLGNVSNTSDANKPISTATQTALNGKVDNSRVLTDIPLNAKFTDTNTTYSEITTAEIDAGTASTLRTITARRIKYILDKVASMISSLTKSDVGLSNVDNTSDLNKPISSATQTALGNKADKTQVLTDVPTNAKFTDTVYTHPTTHPYSMITGAPTSLPASGGDASTVNGFTILKSVPANANFSDTTYTVISTAEIDAGVSTTSRTISGVQVKHMLDKTKPVLSKVKPTNGSPIWYEEL